MLVWGLVMGAMEDDVAWAGGGKVVVRCRLDGWPLWAGAEAGGGARVCMCVRRSLCARLTADRGGQGV